MDGFLRRECLHREAKTPFRDTIGAPVEPFYALLGALRYTISAPVEPFYALLGAFRYTIFAPVEPFCALLGAS